VTGERQRVTGERQQVWRYGQMQWIPARFPQASEDLTAFDESPRPGKGYLATPLRTSLAAVLPSLPPPDADKPAKRKDGPDGRLGGRDTGAVPSYPGTHEGRLAWQC